MALQLNLATTHFGVPAPEAYAKIETVSGDKGLLHVHVHVYFNKETRDQNASSVANHAHYISVSDLNGKGDLFTAIYSVLKTLPEYQGALDV